MLKTNEEYLSQIKQVGKYNLKDTFKWRERALFFQKVAGNNFSQGYYTDLVEDTLDWHTFWDEEERKIQEGVWIDGFYIPGLYYFYLNYLPIYRKQDNEYNFPDIYDSDYHTFLCLEHAVFLKKHFGVIKKRQCIDKDSFIYTPTGVETIENLFNQGYRGSVYSLNENKELVTDLIEDIWVAKKVNQILKITLTGGKTIECTDKHKINTTEGWKEAKDLKIKDILYTIIPPFGSISIEESEAIVMGYFFADGSYSQKNIAPKFTNTNPDYLDDFEYHFLKWRKDCSIRKHIKGNGYDYVITNKEKSKGKPNPFKRYLFEQGLCNKDAERTIPVKYMNLNKESTSLLINRIFAGDGWLSRVYNSQSNSYRYEIGIGSLSLKFLNQLSFLLSKFDINCSIKETSFGKKQRQRFYKLRIYKTKESEKFLTQIGIFKKDDNLNIVKVHEDRENTSQIKKIEIIQKETITYDLKTKNTSSFFANGIHVHNSGFSLKFCTPLIRELWFSRGSPNYIATYEEPQVQKAWAEILEPYREHLNTYTPWYRDFSPDKSLNWRVAKEMVDEQGRKVVKGRINSLKGLVLSKSASKGVGGCNLKGTLIKMADSSLMKVEDIRVGDFVVGKDGKSKKVLNLFSGVSEMYEIHQSKAMSYVVTPNHQLHLYDQRKNKFVDIEAQDFYKLQPFSQTKLNGFKHDPIVYCEDKNLPIDPYFLGAFLGDGHKGKYSIVVNKTKDIEIYNYLKELCIKENLIFKETHRNISRPEYNDDIYDVWFKRNGANSTSYHRKCRLLGLEIKHIPSIYLTSGIPHRLQLLAGLVDTDGYYNAKRHRYELSIKCDILRKDITKLIEDLGFIVRTHKKTNNGKSSTVYNKETSIHVLHITGSIHTIPVKIKRKIAPNQPRKNSKGFSKLTINKWGLGEYFGFECEDNLYCLEDGTVTHNSAKWIFADECFGKDTPVLMSDYSVKKIQDIQLGEFVLGVDGQPKQVINSCSGIDQMYEIKQRKGLNYTVNSKHKLVLEKRNHREDNGVKYLTPEEYLNLDKYSLRTHYGIKNNNINFPSQTLKLNPYFLGLWLGDGTTNYCEVIVNPERDIEILDFLKEYATSLEYTYSLGKCTAPTCKMFRFKSNYKPNILTMEMKELGIFSNKRIPKSYIETSEKDRLELLAGLIDSDGYLAKGTASYSFNYEIGVTKKDLAEDIKLLARSLGFYVSFRLKPAKKTTLKNGHVIHTKEQCSIQIRGDIKRIPVKVNRKKPPKDYVKLKENNHLITSFKIQPKGLGEYYGIEIDGDSKLFLLEDFTVVHNCGVNPVLNKFIGYIKPMITYGNVTTGTIIASGAVGELKHLDGGLKEIITNPEAHNFYYVENIWDKDNELAGKRCGFFVPESWAFFGEDENGVPFVDEHGNSDVERTEAYILRKREEIKQQSLEDYLFAISQAPLTLMECFQYRNESIFPKELIDKQISIIEMKEEHGTFIDLVATKSGKPKHKILDKKTHPAILSFPVKSKEISNKDGVIQVWEFPMENPPYGLYWAGVDICRDSESLNSPSIHCIDIFKGSHRLSTEFAANKPVASYRCRPKDKMDFYKKAMLLLDFYNAEALVENNIRWFIQEAIKDKKQYKISKTPKWLMDITPNSTSQLTMPYGVPMTTKLKEELIDTLVRYVSEVTHVTYDENTGEAIEHFGVERIKNLFVLKEMISWKPIKEQTPKDNYDNVISLGLAIMSAQKAEMLGIIQEDEPSDEIKALIRRKNSKLPIGGYITKSASSYLKRTNGYMSSRRNTPR